MAHMLARYAVSVTLSGEPQLLGDFDGHGANLRRFLADALSDVNETSDDGKRMLAVEGEPDTIADTVDALFATGEAGVRSRIRKPNETVQRNPEDAEDLRSFALFRTPSGARVGDAVIHQPHGRGIRSMLTKALRKRFNERFPPRSLTLKIEPAVPAEELRRLYEQGLVERVRLVAHEPPSDAFDRIGDYAQPDDIGAVETHLRPHRGGRLWRPGQTIQQAVEGAASGTTVVFAGVDYDELKIDLDIGGGRTKVVTVVPTLDSGNLRYDVDDELEFADDEPLRGSLRKAALRLLDDTQDHDHDA